MRAEVEARWRDILAGRRSREEVHDWTREDVPFVVELRGGGPGVICSFTHTA
jgi:hypothetical protein